MRHSAHTISIVVFLSVAYFPSIYGAKQNATAVVKPLIYERLRFDKDYLQIYRRYQRLLQEDEIKVKIKASRPVGDSRNQTEEIDYEFYINDRVESTSITEDDLIFEALDRTYQTRLIPVYIANYDTESDLERASDPRLVSAARCKRDLDFLVDQLDQMLARQEAQQDLTMSQLTSLELMALFDSIAAEEPGLLMGNYHWPGNWRQCRNRQILALGSSDGMQSEVISFKGRYCLASLRSPTWKGKIKKRIEELREKKYFKYDRQPEDYDRFFRIQLGICLPESCDSRVIKTRRHDVQKLTVFKLRKIFQSYELSDLFCLPDDSSELRKLEPSGRLMVAALSVWLALIGLCTIHDYLKLSDPSQKRATVVQKLVDSLSFRRNFQRLVETKSCRPTSNESSTSRGESSKQTNYSVGASTSANQRIGQHDGSPKPNDLLFLNGIKVLSMPLVIFGHVGMLLKHLDRFPLDYDSLNSNFLFNLNACAVFFVNYYFVVSGFLVGYLMFVTKKVKRNTPVRWIYFIFHRYWRLGPLYILLFWFSRSLFMHTSEGPLWDYGTSNMTLRSICRRESWFWPITLTSNLHPLHEECILPVWYIACDLQFHIITPLLLVLLNKSPLMGWLAGLGTIGACILLRLHRYLTDERAQPIELIRPRYDLYMRNNWDMHATYLEPQYRIDSFMIGLLAGHYCFMVLSGRWTSRMFCIPQGSPSEKQTSKPKSRRALAESGSNGLSSLGALLRLSTWLVGAALLLIMSEATWIASSSFPVAWERHAKYITAPVYAIPHATVGLGLALVITAFMLGQFAPLRRFLSHPSWTVVSRVNFVVFLTQVEWIYWLFQSADRPIELNPLQTLETYLYLICIIYAAAVFGTLLFESPILQLERNFIGVCFAGSGAKAARAPERHRQSQQAATQRAASEASSLVGGERQAASD